jgi:hypothetical protein
VDRIACPWLAKEFVDLSLKRALSRTLSTIIVLVVIISATVAGYAFYTGGRENETTSVSQSTSNSTNTSSLIASLAYAHWAAVGEKNLIKVMSQYSTRYEAVWFFISNSSLGLQNGKYDCNVPTGPNNCNSVPESAWQTFFSHTSSLRYFVCNYSMTAELGGRNIVEATVWYQLENLNQTLMVPYWIDIQNYNNTWAVWIDWFGLQQNQAVLFPGYIVPTC